jgi:hypothetical protein
MRTQAASAAAFALLVLASTVEAADLEPETAAAWNGYIAGAAVQRGRCDATCAFGDPAGRVMHVAGGTIHHWTASTVVRGTTVDKILHGLMYPGTPPPQEDVLASRLLDRNGNVLRVYLKLTRSAIVTVTYDTEHEVTFDRRSAELAASRSIATKIAETGGGDRGFLWRLNSYWRYVQVGGDVRIDLESISLSRDVPRLARPFVAPIVERMARESIERTLTSVRQFFEARRG